LQYGLLTWISDPEFQSNFVINLLALVFTSF